MLHFQNSFFFFFFTKVLVLSAQTFKPATKVSVTRKMIKLSLTHSQEMAVLLSFRMCKADAHFARTLMIIELRDSIIQELFRESRSRRKTHVGHDSSSQFLSDLSLYGPLERVLHLDDILFTQTHALLPGNTALWDVIRMLPLLG